MINDILVCGISKNKQLHFYITILSETARIAQKNHNLNIISSAIFSRALVSGILLSGNLKNSGDSLILNWNVTGPAKKIVVDVNYEGFVRGYIGETNLQYIEGSLKDDNFLSEPYIGFGEIIISRLTKDSREPYNSVTVVETGEIAADISIYLKQSFQIDSAIKIGLSITKDNYIELCGGILIMALPDASEDYQKFIYKKLDNMGSFTNLLKNTNIDIIQYLSNELEFDILSQKKISFNCNCHKDNIAKILKNLSLDDFKNYIDENGSISATCQYCGKIYTFLPEELKK